MPLSGGKKGPGLKCSSKNENVKPRLTISSENVFFRAWGKIFFVCLSENDFSSIIISGPSASRAWLDQCPSLLRRPARTTGVRSSFLSKSGTSTTSHCDQQTPRHQKGKMTSKMIDDRQITHLMRVRLKHLLYEFWGVFWASFLLFFVCKKGAKPPLKSHIANVLGEHRLDEQSGGRVNEFFSSQSSKRCSLKSPKISLYHGHFGDLRATFPALENVGVHLPRVCKPWFPNHGPRLPAEQAST